MYLADIAAGQCAETVRFLRHAQSAELEILFLLIELVRGKKLDPKYEGVASMVGLVLLLALFVFVLIRS